jgi:hypothetical protein
VAAHSSAPATSFHQDRPIFDTVGLLLEEKVIAKAQLGIFELGIRGPPEV